MAGSYLEQFLESIQTLPCDLRRSLKLIYDLDSKVDVSVNLVEKLSLSYIKNANELTAEEKKFQFQQIMECMDKAQHHSEEKKELAHQIYNMVDKHIRRLDIELEKFNIELNSKVDGNQTTSDTNNKDLNATNTNIKQKKRPKSSSSTVATSNTKSEKSIAKTSNKHNQTDTMDENKKFSRNSENDPPNGLFKHRSFGSTDLLDMEVDPNEPLYCICHQVSFGEMVGCDDVDCPIEWFHFTCVNLTSKPKGKWYCPQCTLKRKNKSQSS